MPMLIKAIAMVMAILHLTVLHLAFPITAAAITIQTGIITTGITQPGAIITVTTGAITTVMAGVITTVTTIIVRHNILPIARDVDKIAQGTRIIGIADKIKLKDPA